MCNKTASAPGLRKCVNFTAIESYIHSGNFYSVFSSPLLLRGAPDYSVDTVWELARRSATGNHESRTFPRSLSGGFDRATFQTQGGTPTAEPPHSIINKLCNLNVLLKITYLSKSACDFLPFSGIGVFCVAMTLRHGYEIFQRKMATVVKIHLFKICSNFSSQKV